MADEPLVPLTRPQLQLGILEAFDASMDILRPGEKGRRGRVDRVAS
jgi:hypothetical protein